MKHLVCFLEEHSAEEMLKVIIPKLIPKVNSKFIVFQGKQDMEKRIAVKMRNYQVPDAYFLVLRDQDSGDCKLIKRQLFKKVKESGKANKTVIRIACRELESFFLGDLQAVAKGLGLPRVEEKQGNRKYRDPDNLGKPSEELKKLTRNRYQKIQGSRSIAPHLNLNKNTSHSFCVLLSALRGIQE